MWTKTDLELGIWYKLSVVNCPKGSRIGNSVGCFELINCLPTLSRVISDQIRNVQSELTNLPESFADDPQLRLISLCAAFVQEIDSYPFIRDTFVKHYKTLEMDIKRTQLQFNILPLDPTPDEALRLSAVDDEQNDGTVPRWLNSFTNI